MLFPTDGSRLLSAAQFVAGDPPMQTPSWFRQFHFAHFSTLAVHDFAPVTQFSSSTCELTCIGHIVDPRRPELANDGIVRQLAIACNDFAQLESATATLTGRWALFARIGQSARLYPDASGLKSLFYVVGSEGLSIASQPGLLASVSPSARANSDLSKPGTSSNALAWPAQRTPYEGIKQLLPNHYLDLSTATARRFWPQGSIEPLELDSAAKQIGHLLEGGIRGVIERDDHTTFTLTGGMDSRTLLAAAVSMWDRLKFITVVDWSTPLHDVWIPYQLSKRLRLRHNWLWTPRVSTELVEVQHSNTSGMFRDPNQHQVFAFGKAGRALMLVGGCSEVCRCYYHPVHDPAIVDAALLSTLSGWGHHQFAVDAFEDWLADVPSNSGVSTLDLFYWECRLGNWAALSYTADDAFLDQIPPFNSREILAIGLGTSVDNRRPPYRLHRRVCELMAGQVLEQPVNSTWLDSVRQFSRPFVPTRLRSSARRVRHRLAGGSPRAE